MGFSVPLANWLRGPLAKRLLDTVKSERLGDCGIFDMSRLRQLANEHVAGQFDHSRPLWSILVLDGFLRKHPSQQWA
jgi:asparagine synthase (glutamine-hydrolysing)